MMTVKHGLTPLFMAFAICSPHLAQAGEETDTLLDRENAAAQIRAFLAGQQQANAQGMPELELAERFYLRDATIIGEGEDRAKRGMVAAVQALREWNTYLGPGGQKGCNFTLQEPVVSGGDMAAAYAVLSCKANPPMLDKAQTIRQLFVFKHTSAGWRVAQEMWQSGGF